MVFFCCSIVFFPFLSFCIFVRVREKDVYLFHIIFGFVSFVSTNTKVNQKIDTENMTKLIWRNCWCWFHCFMHVWVPIFKFQWLAFVRVPYSEKEPLRLIRVSVHPSLTQHHNLWTKMHINWYRDIKDIFKNIFTSLIYAK